MKALKLLFVFLVFGAFSLNANVGQTVDFSKSGTNKSAIEKTVNTSSPQVEKMSVKKKTNKKTSGNIILEVILAFLLPPLAVFIHSGIGTPFWINLILTILGWVPGVIHALLVVFGVI